MESLTSSVPGAEQIDTAGEETRLKETEQDSHARELTIVLDETHSNHNRTPEQRNACKVNARTESTNHNGGGGLEQDVRNEEEEVGNILVHGQHAMGC
jgi:hypothetical protein